MERPPETLGSHEKARSYVTYPAMFSFFYHIAAALWGSFRIHGRKTYAAPWRYRGARRQHRPVKKLRYSHR